MTSTASQRAFVGLGSVIAAAIAPIKLIVDGRVDECLANAGHQAVIVNWVWSSRAPVETSRQFGAGLGGDIVDFTRMFNVEIALRAATDDTLAQANVQADALVSQIRAALMPGPAIADPTFGGIVRHYVGLGPVQNASEAFAGAARIAARVIPVMAHLRAIGDPD